MGQESVSWDEARMVEHLFHSFLKRLTSGGHDDPAADLPLAQLRLCNALDGKARSMSAISRELGTSLSAVTQIADRLEKAGLVKRAPRSDDRRVRCLQLTDRGDEMMRRHEESRIQRMAKVLAVMPLADRQTVTASLEQLVEAAGRIDSKHDSGGNGTHFDVSRALI